MKRNIIAAFLVILSFSYSFGQEDNSEVDAPLGLRIIRNGQDYLVYADKNLTPNFEDYRKINFQVYFRKVNFPVKKINNKQYQLISIPGSSKPRNQETVYNLSGEVIEYPRAGRKIDKKDYGQNFWIESEIIEKFTETEHYKYANDVFSGLLTAPFKYRLKVGNAPEAIIDGDFNIAPFIGWKWRVSSRKPHYIAPFGFAGVTTLSYNSANNREIEEADRLENGSGLTYGAGLSFRFGNVSPGLIVGWDKGLGDLGNGFMYSDKAWLSFSVNYDFFKPNPASKVSQ